MRVRARFMAGLGAVGVLTGAGVVAVVGPAPTSVAAPERDSSLSGADHNPDDPHPGEDSDPGGDPEPGGADDASWRWVLHQDVSTGEVRTYRVDAAGRLTETFPEEVAAVEFLTLYLDSSVPIRERIARIRPHVSPAAVARVVHDPFFRHPPATRVTGDSSRATADTGAQRDSAVRTVFVGTDIGDYRVALAPGRGGSGTAWEVHSVLPPASWLRPALEENLG